MTAEKSTGAVHTLKYKLETVWPVQGGQTCAVTAKMPG